MLNGKLRDRDEAEHVAARAQTAAVRILDGVKTVGVTAGASTPNWLVDKIVKHLEAIGRDQDAGLKP